MKPRIALWAIALVLPVVAEAQIRLGLTVRPSPALCFEQAAATLNILNDTGAPLDLGPKGNARVRYVVRDHRGNLLPRWQGDGEVYHDSVIAPTTMGTVTSVLNGIYRIQSGSYVVEAEVQWRDLTFVSEKKYLEVVPGVTVLDLRASLPTGETRLYSLKVQNRDMQDRAFLRVDDPDHGLCLGVIDLGRYVRMDTPSMRMDGAGRLHVLHQSGPNDYAYNVILPNARIDQSSTHGGEYTVVRLKTMDDGSVRVSESSSGERRPKMPETISDKPLDRRERRAPTKK